MRIYCNCRCSFLKKRVSKVYTSKTGEKFVYTKEGSITLELLKEIGFDYLLLK